MATATDPRLAEREGRLVFAVSHSDPRYCPWLGHLYGCSKKANKDHFEDRLDPQHLDLGPTPSRTLARCQQMTGYGATCQITLRAELVFATRADWVNTSWNHRLKDAEVGRGHRRAVEDLLLRMLVQQYVMEVEGHDESRYYGFGPHFLRHANRIGLELGLGTVAFNRAGPQDAGQPICKGWPHNVRPDGYYGQDITQELFDRLTHPPKSRAVRVPPPPTLGLWEFILFLQAAGRHADVTRIAAAQVDRLRAARRQNLVLTKFEAGCEENVILRHLRARNEHDARCWVMKALLANAR